jgi:hypothetical protein
MADKCIMQTTMPGPACEFARNDQPHAHSRALHARALAPGVQKSPGKRLPAKKQQLQECLNQLW